MRDSQEKFYIECYKHQIAVIWEVYKELAECADAEGIRLIDSILRQLSKKAMILCKEKS